MDKRKAKNLEVKRSITNALFKLMKTKSLSDISITELIQEAGTARASFYRNYTSKEDVLVTLVKDVLIEFCLTVPNNPADYTCYENILHGFRYFKKYSSYLIDIDAAGMGNTVTKQALSALLTRYSKVTISAPEKYMLAMFLGAFMTTASIWIQSGMKETPEEMADFFFHHIHISPLEVIQ